MQKNKKTISIEELLRQGKKDSSELRKFRNKYMDLMKVLNKRKRLEGVTIMDDIYLIKEKRGELIRYAKENNLIGITEVVQKLIEVKKKIRARKKTDLDLISGFYHDFSNAHYYEGKPGEDVGAIVNMCKYYYSIVDAWRGPPYVHFKLNM